MSPLVSVLLFLLQVRKNETRNKTKNEIAHIQRSARGRSGADQVRGISCSHCQLSVVKFRVSDMGPLVRARVCFPSPVGTSSLGSRRVCHSPFKFCPSPHFGAHLKHRFQKGLENGAEEDATRNLGSGILMGHGLKYLLRTVPPDLLLLAGLLGSHSPFMSLV